jgi:hypothetical protein
LSNKIVTTKSNAIFLAAILVLGTITTISPSFMLGIAQAEPYYGGIDNYKKSSGKDVSVKNVKCNNINVNLNGLELNLTSVPFLSNLLASEAHADEGERGANSYGSDGSYGDKSRSDGDFKFICINNNNNTVIVGNGTTTPEPLTCEECFTENIIDELQLTNFTGTLVVYTEFGDLEGLCEFLSDPSFTNNEKIAQLSLIFSRTLIPTDVRLSILECLDERGIINVGSGGDRPNR